MPRVEPVRHDLLRFLRGAGLYHTTETTLESYLDLQLALDAAYEDFKKAVGIKVFFAETSATTRYYDTQGGPLVQIPPYFTITAVHVGQSFETSSESFSKPLEYLDFPSGDPPYTRLHFRDWQYAGPQRIGVTGRRGWSDDFPADAFQAILGRAAGVHLAPSIAGAINNGAISWREGDVSEQYGPMGAFSAAADRWAKAWQRVTMPAPAGYRQVTVYAAGRL